MKVIVGHIIYFKIGVTHKNFFNFIAYFYKYKAKEE